MGIRLITIYVTNSSQASGSRMTDPYIYALGCAAVEAAKRNPGKKYARRTFISPKLSLFSKGRVVRGDATAVYQKEEKERESGGAGGTSGVV